MRIFARTFAPPSPSCAHPPTQRPALPTTPTTAFQAPGAKRKGHLHAGLSLQSEHVSALSLLLHLLPLRQCIYTDTPTSCTCPTFISSTRRREKRNTSVLLLTGSSADSFNFLKQLNAQLHQIGFAFAFSIASLCLVAPYRR